MINEERNLYWTQLRELRCTFRGIRDVALSSQILDNKLNRASANVYIKTSVLYLNNGRPSDDALSRAFEIQDKMVDVTLVHACSDADAESCKPDGFQIANFHRKQTPTPRRWLHSSGTT